MNSVISASALRATIPEVVAKVRRGARFTVIYRNYPAFQIVPIEGVKKAFGDLNADSLYRAKPVGRSNARLSSADHDASLYGG